MRYKLYNMTFPRRVRVEDDLYVNQYIGTYTKRADAINAGRRTLGYGNFYIHDAKSNKKTDFLNEL